MGSHIAVIGKTGQLARALHREIDNHVATASFYDRGALNLNADKDIIERFIKNLPSCDAIILAAAYTHVDQAETDRETAITVNGHAPGIIAKICKERDIPLIHISTDYVFDGTSTRPYKVTDQACPINIYGQSKYKGELNIQKTKCRNAIVRTSWVYDGGGKNFLTTMLQLSENTNILDIVDDQKGRPTYAGHLAKAILSITDGLISRKAECEGIFHISNTGPIISWADFAKAIFKTQNLDIHINPISSMQYPTPANRPAFSALDTRKFETLFDYTMPSWQEGLSAALDARIK